MSVAILLGPPGDVPAVRAAVSDGRPVDRVLGDLRAGRWGAPAA